MRRALHVEPPVVHVPLMLNVGREQIELEPPVVANPSSRIGILDVQACLASFDVMVKGKHTLPLEYNAKR